MATQPQCPAPSSVVQRPEDHKRTYKACFTCRQSKVRCVVIDETACVRCVRERRKCIFPQHRAIKKRKAPGGGGVKASFENGVPSSSSGTNEAPENGQAEGSGSQALNTSIVVPDVDDRNDELRNTSVLSTTEAIGLLFKAVDHPDSDEATDYQTPSAAVPTSITPGSASNLSKNPLWSRFELSSVTDEVIQNWRQHRFVRQGWFSAREAVTYIDLFFQNLAPLSPVASLIQPGPDIHKLLVHAEPLLCCVLLTISSRCHILSGQEGPLRTVHIHTRLWRHCEHLISRIMFGTEKLSTAKTRTTYSIFALLLITEWHARNTYFPPENDGWDSSLADCFDYSFTYQDQAGDASESLLRWREEVYEPVRRSERMSWSLAGLATTLAHELGMFLHSEGDKDGSLNASSDRIRLHVRALLGLYVTQLSLRLGCSNILQPGSLASSSRPLAGSLVISPGLREQELFLKKWIDITRVLKMATDMINSKMNTILQSDSTGGHLEFIAHFRPLLLQWHTDYEATQFNSISSAAKECLLMEYYYVYMYVHSFAVQAVLERASHFDSVDSWCFTAQRFEHAEDFRFIVEMRTASCEILAAAIRLEEAGHLRFSPVRVYLRIVVASIFLLKAIGTGASKTEIESALETLGKCISALQSNRGDEIHLSARFARLLSRHMRRFKSQLQAQAPATGFSSSVTGLFVSAEDSVLRRHGEDFEVQGHGTIDDTELGSSAGFDPWLALPYDASMAPFGWDSEFVGANMSHDSLNFFWNS